MKRESNSSYPEVPYYFLNGAKGYINAETELNNICALYKNDLAQTARSVTIESECIGKVYAPDEFDKNEWTVEGEPNTTITVEKPATVELTCATIVNRIPDVINAPSGYVTTEKLGDLQYKIKPLNEYVK